MENTKVEILRCPSCASQRKPDAVKCDYCGGFFGNIFKDESINKYLVDTGFCLRLPEYHSIFYETTTQILRTPYSERTND